MESPFDNLFEDYRNLGSVSAYLVAYSGGLDSHVLLELTLSIARQSQRPVRVVHINHGLSPNASSWQDHCS